MNDIIEQRFYIYKDANGNVNVNALMRDETLWLTQKSMAELFDVEVPAISKHINNIFESKELAKEATVSKMEIVQTEGSREVSREVDFYNLDMIIAVGYRVNSAKATAFRIWATNVLKEYIIKGFALDDNRLKNGRQLDKAHFRELLDRIKEIRTSERMLYQQLKDIYALSEDYSYNNAESLIFFAKVQNKVHYAITGQTSAEIIVTRANAEKENMGLRTWKNSPGGRITKSDVIIAKNYLDKGELENLRSIVNMFLDYAEMQAKAQNPIFMKDWFIKLDNFLAFNEKPILHGSGKYTRTQALRKSNEEYTKYREKQRLQEKKQAQLEYAEDIHELDLLLKEKRE